jgi:Fe2+ transport system protein B
LVWAIFLTLLVLFFAVPFAWQIRTQMLYDIIAARRDLAENIITQDQYNQMDLWFQVVRRCITASIALLCILPWVSLFVFMKPRKN